ncbi:MAG: ABC transporter permease [Thiolinea sp.]
MNKNKINSTLTLGFQLLRRDIEERYAGTLFGWLWLLIHPLFMLAIYTLIFGEVLQLRFGEAASTSHFAFYLFAGLIVFNALSEVMTRATLILQEKRDMLLNTSLSPWLLPILPVLASVLLEWLALLILLFGMGLRGEVVFAGILFYLPYFCIRVILSLAVSYLIAPLAVFLRDLRQLMPALLTVLLFVSPILYPLEVIPERFLPWYDWNFLGHLVQGYRAALMEGVFDATHMLNMLLISLLFLVLSVVFFRNLMPRARYVL